MPALRLQLFVIASDPALAGERGNPTKSLRGRSPCLHAEVVIYRETFLLGGRSGTQAWQSQEFRRFARDKASVVSLPGNDVATQSLMEGVDLATER